MDEIFLLVGVASLQLIPIFTITYLQNELAKVSKVLESIPARLLSAMAMWLAFGLLFVSTLLAEQSARVIISVLLINVLSMSINYTYRDYTVDEGFYISIPYFILYSCLVFVISMVEHPFYTFQSVTFFIMFISSLLCHILFSTPAFLGVELSTSYLNYIAFVGLIIASFNVMLIIDRDQSKQIKSVVNFLLFQLVHIYLYLTHLLSVKFEEDPMAEPKTSKIRIWWAPKG